MEKNGICPCGSKLSAPQNQCIIQCKQCRRVSLFVCHLISTEIKDNLYIRCTTCKSLYTLFTCPKCEGTSIIKDFKPGHTYTCVCELQGTFLTCNKCADLMCLPTRKNYQNTVISCKKCQNKFKFRVCSQCKQISYLKENQSGEGTICFNEQCSQSHLQNNTKPQDKKITERVDNFQKIAARQSTPIVYPELNPNSNPYETQTNKSNPNAELCKICLNNPSTMINTKCFHLSVCEKCFYDLKGKCPICRAEGTYTKVFKA